MIRTDREITYLSEIESILNNAMVCRIGMLMLVSPILSRSVLAIQTEKFTFIQLCPEKKLPCWRKTPGAVLRLTSVTALYEVSSRVQKMQYQSVIGFGRANIISDSTEKKQGLNCIMCHYGSGMWGFPMMTSEMSV